MLIVRARARANPVLRSVLIVLAVLIVLWLAWLTSSMRLGALASVDRWRQITVSPFEGPLPQGAQPSDTALPFEVCLAIARRLVHAAGVRAAAEPHGGTADGWKGLGSLRRNEPGYFVLYMVCYLFEQHRKTTNM